MNIESINVDGITNIEDAKRVMREMLDCIFIMQRDIQRQLNHLTSQNVKEIDFNITRVKNIKKVL